MKITFYGAAQNVTGSKHLVETQGFRVLLDCGLYQGKRSLAYELNSKLPFDAKSIDAVILSHAHADHCGLLPVLVREGFRGKIYCTNATAEITRYILLDSASVQEQEAKYHAEHSQPGDKIFPPLYSEADVLECLKYFSPLPYYRLTKQWVALNENVRLKFYDAGHILGSAITYLEIKEGDKTQGLVFTGDLGKSGAPILHDPEVVEEQADVLISEATYGGRTHLPITAAVTKLKEVINFAVNNKSKIIVPAFALGRVQELIYILHGMIDDGTKAIPMYVDTPLGLNISEVFLRHSEDFNEGVWKDFGSKNEEFLRFDSLKYIHSAEESKALNSIPGPLMIIASSGMMEGGRVLFHLKNNIEDPTATVLITGYQAEHTLGRKIQNGISPVRVLDRMKELKARVVTIDEFSAHADQPYLEEYMSKLKGLKKVFLVHTEFEQAEALKNEIKEYEVEIPKLGESFEI
ncbi:MAG: MBL fold metallo-hydrolase [Candidatus Doudnabacteria bacterium]